MGTTGLLGIVGAIVGGGWIFDLLAAAG